MCDVFSWIEDKQGKIWFLEDKDCEIILEKYPVMGWIDVVGHSAIKKMFDIDGMERESILSVPKEIRDAVNAGRCDRLLKENGCSGLRYDSEGNIKSPWWPGKFIRSISDVKFMDNHGEIDKTWKVFDTRAAARDAAWDAALDAARDAALDAARDAARDAALDAAWDAAWDAALDAARDAALDAALDAARDAARDAAWDAARDAARDAALDAALYALCFVAFHDKPKNKHFIHARKRWEVWKRGYKLFGDVDGVFYVYMT